MANVKKKVIVLNRLTQIQHGSIATVGYPLYDKVGNRKQMTNSQGTHTYTYDALYQLESVTGAITASYNYDFVGNRINSSDASGTAIYTPNNLNQYSSVDSIPYTYDLNGNLTNDGDQIYEYDYENRLIRVTPAPPNVSLRDGVAVEAIYAYDPFGRRITKTVDSTATTYLYDGDQILETYPCNLTTGTCSLSQSFLYGPGIDEPLELTDHPSLTKHYYHQDGLGSVTQITDSTGSLEESYFYSPYGIPEIRDASNTIIPQSLIGNPFLFTGLQHDFETRLTFNRNRHSSPFLGRFIQRDPIDFADGFNLFHYAFNDPINFTDPYGLFVSIEPIPTGVGTPFPLENIARGPIITPISDSLPRLTGDPITPVSSSTLIHPIDPPQPKVLTAIKFPKSIQVLVGTGLFIITALQGNVKGIKRQDIWKSRPPIELVIPAKRKQDEKDGGCKKK